MVGAEGAKFHLTYPTRENFLFSSKIRISKTVLTSPENIETFLEQLNTHPETISGAQNEPNGHFQNLDFSFFSRTEIENAHGSTTSRVATLIKK